jgi:branched-subunit amino acid aminotransferase/4-amino-4-deoxychorismate lyase
VVAFARPWVDLFTPEVQARGAHLIIAKVPRIPEESIDPTVKNFHWGDLTGGLFEAHDAGVDGAVLVDRGGFVTEGPGYNIFSVTAGEVSTPDRGVLEGVTRKSMIELCAELDVPCHVRPLPVAELLRADEIFVTTSAGGPMPVSRIDDISWAMIAQDRCHRILKLCSGRSVKPAGTVRQSITRRQPNDVQRFSPWPLSIRRRGLLPASTIRGLTLQQPRSA